MDTKKRSFLDQLPAPHKTLIAWRSDPALSTLWKLRSAPGTEETASPSTVEFAVDMLRQKGEVSIHVLFYIAGVSFRSYFILLDAEVPESDPFRTDMARVAYQSCLNFRQNLKVIGRSYDELIGSNYCVELILLDDVEQLPHGYKSSPLRTLFVKDRYGENLS